MKILLHTEAVSVFRSCKSRRDHAGLLFQPAARHMSEKPLLPLTTQILKMPKWLKYLQLLSIYHLRLLHTFYSVSSGFVGSFLMKAGFLCSLGKLFSSIAQFCPTGTTDSPVTPGEHDLLRLKPSLHWTAHSLPFEVKRGKYFNFSTVRIAFKWRCSRTVSWLS